MSSPPGRSTRADSASSRRGRRPLQVLEQVGGEHHVERAGVEARQVRAVTHLGLDVLGRGAPHGGVQIHRHHPPRRNGVGEVAPPGAQFQDVGVRGDPALQIGAQVFPDGGAMGVRGEPGTEVGGNVTVGGRR